jgi:hypothetical protein
VELAWDAVHGTPLRAAVYARGASSPVLELRVTDISFGPVPDSVLAISPPPGTKVTHLAPPRGHTADTKRRAPVTGRSAVDKRVGFRVVAPRSVAGRKRNELRLIESGRSNGALVTYGRGLDGIAVLELPSSSERQSSGWGEGRESSDELNLPSVSVDGVAGKELETAIGTVIQFKRGGIDYTVAGSVPSSVAEDVARGL